MDKKYIYQYLTAIGLLFSGVLLSFLGFYTEPVGEISQSVQWFFGECLIWAGSLFGMTTYVDWRIKREPAHALGDVSPSDEEAHAPGDQPTRWAKRRQAMKAAHALRDVSPSDEEAHTPGEAKEDGCHE